MNNRRNEGLALRAGVIGVFFIAISVVEALSLLPNLRYGLAENVSGLAIIALALAGAWVAFSLADHEDRVEILERGLSSVRKKLDGVDERRVAVEEGCSSMSEAEEPSLLGDVRKLQ